MLSKVMISNFEYSAGILVGGVAVSVLSPRALFMKPTNLGSVASFAGPRSSNPAIGYSPLGISPVQYCEFSKDGKSLTAQSSANSHKRV